MPPGSPSFVPTRCAFHPLKLLMGADRDDGAEASGEPEIDSRTDGRETLSVRPSLILFRRWLVGQSVSQDEEAYLMCQEHGGLRR